MTSWDEMGEGQANEKPAGSKVRMYRDGPFIYSVFRIYDEAGNYLGELSVGEMIEYVPTPVEKVCYRVKVNDRFAELVKRKAESDLAKEIIKRMGDNKPFDDEDK